MWVFIKEFMKYLLFILLFVPFMAKAQVFSFEDGKAYDITGSLKYFRLMDGTYFDISGKQVWKNLFGDFSYQAPFVELTSISPSIQTYCIDPVKQWKTERDTDEQTYLTALSALNPVVTNYIGDSNKLQNDWNVTNGNLTSQINQRVLECNKSYNYFW